MQIFLLVIGLVLFVVGFVCQLKYLAGKFGYDRKWLAWPIVITWIVGLGLAMFNGIPLVESLFSYLHNCTWRPGKTESVLGVVVGLLLTVGSFIAMMKYLRGTFGTGLPRAIVIVTCLAIGEWLVIFLGLPLT